MRGRERTRSRHRKAALQKPREGDSGSLSQQKVPTGVPQCRGHVRKPPQCIRDVHSGDGQPQQPRIVSATTGKIWRRPPGRGRRVTHALYKQLVSHVRLSGTCSRSRARRLQARNGTHTQPVESDAPAIPAGSLAPCKTLCLGLLHLQKRACPSLRAKSTRTSRDCQAVPLLKSASLIACRRLL